MAGGVFWSEQFLGIVWTLSQVENHTLTPWLLLRYGVELTAHSCFCVTAVFFGNAQTLCRSYCDTVTAVEAQSGVGSTLTSQLLLWVSCLSSLGMLRPELTYHWVKRTREHWLVSSWPSQWRSIHVCHEVEEGRRRHEGMLGPEITYHGNLHNYWRCSKSPRGFRTVCFDIILVKEPSPLNPFVGLIWS